MARKGWDDLSPEYRNRLEKAGISKTAYNRGESIQAARGHGVTPERPKGFNRERFEEYAEKRDDLIRQLVERKHEYFGNRGKDPKHGDRWNAERSRQYIFDYAPPLSRLREALDMSEGEMIDAIREDPELWAFLGY